MNENFLKQSAVLLLSSFLLASNASQAHEEQSLAVAKLVNAEREAIGIATFTETAAGVRATIQVSGLTPGEHAIHIHEVGKCDPPDFMSAGKHFDPTPVSHKHKHDESMHAGHVPAGDLPNITVDADGTGVLVAVLPKLTLRSGTNSLFKPGGTSLMVHAGAGGETTPSGFDPKARIACGIVTRL